MQNISDTFSAERKQQDDAAFRFKVYTEVVKRNDFRFFPVEKGACNTMCTFIGINSERDRCLLYTSRCV